MSFALQPVRPCLARWVFLSTSFVGAGLARQATYFLCLAKESRQRRALEHQPIWPCHAATTAQARLFGSLSGSFDRFSVGPNALTFAFKEQLESSGSILSRCISRHGQMGVVFKRSSLVTFFGQTKKVTRPPGETGADEQCWKEAPNGQDTAATTALPAQWRPCQ